MPKFCDSEVQQKWVQVVVFLPNQGCPHEACIIQGDVAGITVQ
jgi:hypothetical protein